MAPVVCIVKLILLQLPPNSKPGLLEGEIYDYYGRKYYQRCKDKVIFKRNSSHLMVRASRGHCTLRLELAGAMLFCLVIFVKTVV